MLLSLFSLLPLSLLITASPRLNLQAITNNEITSLRVPVILGVMSRCPDAILSETVWNKVLDLVGGLVDINLVFIAKLNETSPIGVTCMHGEGECQGNIQQLCAAKYWRDETSESSQQWQEGSERNPWSDAWNFVQCMNYGPRLEIGDLKTAERCASTIGLEWSGDVATCASGTEGIDLLKESLTMADNLSITKSCTMLINSQQICIHDSTWKECSNGHEPIDFARQVKESWDEINQEV